MTSTYPSFPCRFALAAAGNVGLAVSQLLAARGNEATAVWSRSQGSADRAAEALDTPVVPLEEVGAGTDIVFIGASEAAVEEVARAAAFSLEPGTAVVHFAGAAGIAPLGPVTDIGAIAMALHPVQACPDAAMAVRRLPGSAWGVTCAGEGRAWAHDLISNQLDGMPVDVAEADRPAWHAAAATTANGIAALLASAEAMLAAVGVSDPRSVLGPLAAGAVANATEEGGGAATLTGPVVRAEAEAVSRHVKALAARDGSLADQYRRVAAMILAAARHAERIDPAAAATIAELIERP